MAATSTPIQGTLRDGGALAVFRDAHVEERTGALRVASVETGGREGATATLRVFAIRKGRLVDLDSSADTESLGATLARYELVDLALLQACETEARRARLPLEAVLRTKELLDDARAAEALAARAVLAVCGVLSARDGAWTFEASATVAGHAVELPLGRVVLDALAALEMREPAAIARCAGDPQRVPRFTGRRMDGHGVLTPAEVAVARTIDGLRSVAEIAQAHPQGPVAARRLLVGLIATGIIEWAPEEPASAQEPPPAPIREAAPAPRPPARPSAPPIPASPSPPPAASAPSAVAAPPEDAAARFRKDVTEAFAALATSDHFQILGVARGATDAEISKRYAALVRRYHPDALPDPSLDDLRQPLTTLFVAIGDAYAVLRDPTRRAEYAARLSRQEAQGRLRDGPVDPFVAEEGLEGYVHRAEVALLNHAIWDAARILEEVVPASQGALRTRAEILLARAYGADHRRVRDAERILQGVVTREPQNAEAYLALGSLYRELGMKARARRSLERVLDLQPGHAGAHRELMAIAEGGDGPVSRARAGA